MSNHQGYLILKWLHLKPYGNAGLPCPFSGWAHRDKTVNEAITEFTSSDFRTCTMLQQSGENLVIGRKCFSRELLHKAGEWGSVFSWNLWHSWCLLLPLSTSPVSNSTHVSASLSAAPNWGGGFWRVRSSKCWCRTTVLTLRSKRIKEFILEPNISDHCLETIKFLQMLCSTWLSYMEFYVNFSCIRPQFKQKLQTNTW